MRISLSRSATAQDSLRWTTAFTTVVLVYGAAGWLLLRPPAASGPGAPIVMFDLPGNPDVPPPPRDPTPAQNRTTSDSRGGTQGQTLATKTPEISNEQLAIDDAKQDGPAKAVASVAGPTIPDNDAADQQARALQAPTNPPMPVDAGGGAGAVTGIGRLESMTGAPIDASAGGIRRRGFNGGSNQFKELFEHRQLSEPKEFKELRELEERLFKRPVSIAALPSARHDTVGHQHTPAIGMGSGPARNAIGILTEHPAMPRQIGISPGEQTREAVGARASSQGTSPERRGGGGIASGSADAGESVSPHDSTQHHAAVASVGRVSLNGTGMIRPSSGTGAIGGATRANVGVVNGTNIRTKYP